MLARSAYAFFSLPPFAASASGWLEAHESALITVGIIIVVALVVNFIVRRVIRHAVEKLVAVNEARRLRAEREQSPSDAPATLREQTVERLRASGGPSERSEQRARTVGNLLQYVATITIFVVAALMVLAELGVSIAPLLAGAGVVGVALGFGAQSLVKDFLSGTFMLIEDQFGVGDVVDVGEVTGVVERVTLRVTTLRDLDGTAWHVPNGEIRRIGNKSQHWARIVLDVEVAYDTDIQLASRVIKRAADEEWRARTPGATIIEEPELWGIEKFAESAIVLRLAVKTRPGEQWAAGRAVRARLKAAFDEAGIEIPFPQQTVWLHPTTERPADAAR